MRLSSVLLLIAATFFVKCDAATADTDSTMISVMSTVAPMKGARFLRTVSRQQDNAEEDDEIDALDSQEEERMVAVKNFKPSTIYKNNPLLRPAAEVLAAA
ncbi:hypothetical protein AM588_10002115 [Phytophthora nicotianae]|nr:hypothetical protein AM588_10002115 [Phytophthora nicotianae]